MPDQQAVNQLATTIAEAFNSTLPEPTTPEMTDMMNDIRENNARVAATIATGINQFVKKSTVTVSIPWAKVKQLLTNKIKPFIFLRETDVIICQTNNTHETRLASPNNAIQLNSLGTTSVTITQSNAIQ